jgi:hypothetical protein
VLAAATLNACQTAPAGYGLNGLNRQAALYGEVYKQEGDAYVSGDPETHLACQQLLANMDRLAAAQYGAKWQPARDREMARIDAFNTAHEE